MRYQTKELIFEVKQIGEKGAIDWIFAAVDKGIMSLEVETDQIYIKHDGVAYHNWDYMIKDIKGNIYPIKKEMLELLFESAEL